MIRFSCPGCQAVYTVGPEKAGKSGKCPKCQSQFSIPKLDGAGITGPAPTKTAPAPVRTPAADPDAPVEIAPCPSCGTALTVATQYLGMDVECPTCKGVFAAKMPGAVKPKTSTTSALARTEAPADEDEDDRPVKKKSKRRDDDEDEDERPVKKSKRAVVEDADDEEEAPRKSKRRDEDDEEADDRPKKKKKKKRSTSGEISKRTTAGLLAILLGGYGVHKFYLGYSTPGIITLALTLFTCIGGTIIGIIEGIKYLSMTDEEFIETYQIGRKEWF